jgi:hypothetical protein
MIAAVRILIVATVLVACVKTSVSLYIVYADYVIMNYQKWDRFGLNFLKNYTISTDTNHSIECFIPRDSNVIIPTMILQNVTCLIERNQLFHFYFIN